MKQPETLIQSVFALRRSLSRRIAAGLKGRSPYTFRQLALLALVADGEVTTQAEAAERLGVDPPAVSRLVDLLEEQQLLVRAEGKDRRSSRLQVTPLGRKHAQPLHAAIDALERDLTASLGSKDAATLKRLTGALLAALDEKMEERVHG